MPADVGFPFAVWAGRLDGASNGTATIDATRPLGMIAILPKKRGRVIY